MKVFNINDEVKKTNIVSIGNNINYKVSYYFIEKYVAKCSKWVGKPKKLSEVEFGLSY